MNQKYPYLGTGWRFPPTFAQEGGYLEMVSGPHDVEQSIKIITTTQLGERIMRPNFGCGLSEFAFADLTAGTIAKIHDLIANAIGYHEHRVELANVEVTIDDNDPGRLNINVDYIVIENNSRHNMVFPYYLHEAQQLDF